VSELKASWRFSFCASVVTVIGGRSTAREFSTFEPGKASVVLPGGRTRKEFQRLFIPTKCLGTPGTSKRRFFPRLGLNNYDMALLKTVRLSESKSFQLRLEGFNIFNHPQFFGPQSVDGNISSPSFRRLVSADAPRLVQLGTKFLF
jgi:hypothetical protein